MGCSPFSFTASALGIASVTFSRSLMRRSAPSAAARYRAAFSASSRLQQAYLRLILRLLHRRSR
jgi:hypothetical protein